MWNTNINFDAKKVEQGSCSKLMRTNPFSYKNSSLSFVVDVSGEDENIVPRPHGYSQFKSRSALNESRVIKSKGCRLDVAARRHLRDLTMLNLMLHV